MKQFFKMMFASAFGVFIAIGIIIFISVFSLIGLAASMSGNPEYIPKANTVFKLKLSGSMVENYEENPLASLLSNSPSPLSLNDILRSIRLAKENKNIKGIYLEGGALLAGSAHVDAIRRQLEDFKESGKFVVAYADSYTQSAYYLCSVADKVYLNPQGVLELMGLTSQSIFYKGLLDKIGVDMLVFKVGTHKGAPERFERENLSEENREQISSYQQGIWKNITTGIASSRNISTETILNFANQGWTLADPEKTVELGLIDGLKYKSDVEEYIKELAGQTDKRLKTTGIDKIKQIKEKTGKFNDQIAILYAEGEIRSESLSPFSDNDPVISEKVVNELIKLKNNDKVKAVVFRINSPGGSAFISEQIWHQVKELQREKPVIVSMGNVAASGGYYIACAADKIIAEPNTLTGSIGIFGIFPNATGLFRKIGLTTDIVKTNNFGDLGDISRPMREDEKRLIQSYIERGYDTFLSRCAEGRNMTKEEIDKVAQGRVWTGEQALEKGLVDELGDIQTAIRAAAEIADLSNYQLIHVSNQKDFLKELLEKQLSEMKLGFVKDYLGQEYSYFQQLKEIKSEMGIQHRLPFDI